METSDFTIEPHGPVSLDFSYLESAPADGTSYSSRPTVSKDLGRFDFEESDKHVIATFDCQSSDKIGVEVKGVDSTTFEWFQDYNPEPIGCYINICDKSKQY